MVPEHRSGCVIQELPTSQHLGAICFSPTSAAVPFCPTCCSDVTSPGCPSLTEGPATPPCARGHFSPSKAPRGHVFICLFLLYWPHCGCPGAETFAQGVQVPGGAAWRATCIRVFPVPHGLSHCSLCVWHEPRTEAVVSGPQAGGQRGLWAPHPPSTPAMYTHLGLSFPGCGMGRGPRAEGVQ